MPDTAVPTILFGAFDRHNFGDLLFPHIAAALLAPDHPVYAGLVAADLRQWGGHKVEAIADLAARWHDRPVNIIHAGGELLTCDAWQAAVMTLPPEDVPRSIAHFDGHPQAAQAWAQRRIRLDALAPYTVQRKLFPKARTIVYNAVGGVDLDIWDPAYRKEVLDNLHAADTVGVRDILTEAHLRAAGIRTRLMPDPAVMVAALFGNEIRQRTGEGEVARMCERFPQGYVAVQFNTEFANDATLAQQFEELARATGMGIVFFRAGAAPWHDDIDSYLRVAACMPRTSTEVFRSLKLWDICALIAASQGYLGSSLHGRIVAAAFARPRLNLLQAGQDEERSKQGAFAATWDNALPATVYPTDIAEGMQRALGVPPALLQDKAADLASRYRNDFEQLCQPLR